MKEYINMFQIAETMKKENRKNSTLTKIWHFLWHDNSIWSWIANIILAFLIIKFLLYPGVGLALGTELPIVAVISSSMEHHGQDWMQNQAICLDGKFCKQTDWYDERGITREDFKRFSFKNGFNKGDIMILAGRKTDKIKVGDIIVFSSGKNYPIIHRVVRIYEQGTKTYFETKGDNNPAQIKDSQLNEKIVAADEVFGVAIMRIPYIGYVKIGATELFQNILRR
jgi:signal peptidase I